MAVEWVGWMNEVMGGCGCWFCLQFLNDRMMAVNMLNALPISRTTVCVVFVPPTEVEGISLSEVLRPVVPNAHTSEYITYSTKHSSITQQRRCWTAMLIKHSNIRAVAMNKLCGEGSLISTRRHRIQRRRCDQCAVARCYFVFVLHRACQKITC